MGYVFFHLFIIAMAVLGFAETMHYLITKIYKSNENQIIMLLFPDNSNIEYQLRSCVAKLKWQRYMYPKKIYCVDCGLSEDAMEICKLFCSEYSYIEIISAEKLIESIKSHSKI